MNNIRKTLVSEQRRALDLASVAPSESIVTGRASISGGGEAYIDVNFPVRFSTLPYFTFGFELQEFTPREQVAGLIVTKSEPVPGLMPTGTAYVSEWKTIERPPFSAYYTGARICCTIDAQRISKMIINYHFTGSALTNPSL